MPKIAAVLPAVATAATTAAAVSTLHQNNKANKQAKKQASIQLDANKKQEATIAEQKKALAVQRQDKVVEKQFIDQQLSDHRRATISSRRRGRRGLISGSELGIFESTGRNILG